MSDPALQQRPGRQRSGRSLHRAMVVVTAGTLALTAAACEKNADGSYSLGRNEVVHLCVNGGSGAMKWTRTKSCAPGEILLKVDPATYAGAKGDKGDRGVVGPAGPAGVAGPTGPAGVAGPAGLDGRDGDMGPAGDHGPAGPAGAQGAQGEQGEQGEQGPVGERGPVGPTGATGPRGDTGETGLQGVQGPQGISGIQGLEGPSGPQGIQGPAGTAGKSPQMRLDPEDGQEIQWRSGSDGTWACLYRLDDTPCDAP